MLGSEDNQTFVYNCTMGIPEILEEEGDRYMIARSGESELYWYGKQPKCVQGACRE